MDARSRHPVMTPVLDDALAVATSLSRNWARALNSCQHTISSLAKGFEERLFACMECFEVGDAQLMEQLLAPAFDDENPHRVFVAATALVEMAGDVGPRLLARLDASLAALPFARALGLAGTPRVEAELRKALAKEKDEGRRALLLDVLALRGTGFGVELEEDLRTTEPQLLVAALRASRRASAEVPVRAFAEGALSAEGHQVRDAAIEVGLIHGSRLAWEAARKTVDAGEMGAGVPLAALAVSGEPSDVLRLVKLAAIGEHRSSAIVALGFTGSLAAVEVCLGAMEEPSTAKVAGESFSAITGLRLEKQYAQVEPPQRKEPQAFAQPTSQTPAPDEALPAPRPEAVKQWWAANKSRFQPGLRYFEGVPLDGARLLEGFGAASTRRRPVLALELAIRTGGELQVETRQWARVQLAQRAAYAKTPVMLPFGKLLT